MTSIDDERKAAKEAQAVVSSLVPSSSLTKKQRELLHKTARVATGAALPLFSSQAAVDDARYKASMALHGLGNSLTQNVIERARTAIEAWLKALDHFGV